MTHAEKYTVILDTLAEKIKSQEVELNLKTWTIEHLEKKLKEAEAIIAEHRNTAEECEG